MKRNLKQCSKECKRTAYVALIRSTLEYGSTVWDPHLQKDIEKLEKIQRRAARFICKDYHSRDKGSMTKNLQDLELQTLQNRRKENRLCFLFKINNGLVPAIQPENYLKPIINKRKIKAKNFDDYQSDNFVTRQQNLHNNCFQIPNSKTDAYRYSYFPRIISEWNQLESTSATNVETFRKNISI